LIGANCRVVFHLVRDEACSKQIVDLTQTWYYATVVTKSICLGLVLVENVVETASCNLVKMLTPLQNNEFGECFVCLGSQLDNFIANSSGSVLFGHDSDTLILLVVGDFCRRDVLILKMKVLRIRPVIMSMAPRWVPAVGV
jgi:hypothetical protein